MTRDEQRRFRRRRKDRLRYERSARYRAMVMAEVVDPNHFVLRSYSVEDWVPSALVVFDAWRQALKG